MFERILILVSSQGAASRARRKREHDKKIEQLVANFETLPEWLQDEVLSRVKEGRRYAMTRQESQP